MDYSNILDRLGGSTMALSPQNEALLLEPYTHVHSNPGKGFCAKFIMAFNYWLKVPDDKIRVIIDVVGRLQTTSMLIDDVQDGSHLRRGLPAAHTIYGIPLTINAANYVQSLIYRDLLSLRRYPSDDMKSELGQTENIVHYPINDVLHVVTDEIIALYQGQGLELLWRDNMQCPTEDEYIGMAVNKTGGFLRIAIKLMKLFATDNIDKNFIPLVNVISVYYQIRDDYMNLQSEEYTSKKGFADDLTEGKFSFPIIHGIRTDLTNRLLLNVLQKRPTTPALKNHAISYLRSGTRSFDYTLTVLQTLEQITLAEIDKFGKNPILVGMMNHIRVQDIPHTVVGQQT